jgi:hypothetical protein
MPLWLFMVLLLGLIKLPIAALMLWMPFRNDDALGAADPPGPSDEDGGTRALPAGPLNPRPRSPVPGGPSPRSPRRGPHGCPPPPSPRRIRTAAPKTRRVRITH